MSFKSVAAHMVEYRRV